MSKHFSIVASCLATVAALAVTSSIVIATPAQAASSLDGSKVTATLRFPNKKTILGGPTTATVGPGVEFPAGSIEGDSLFQIDISDSQLTYQPLQDVNYAVTKFNGFVFKFRGAPQITNVTIDPASNFSPKSLSFTTRTVQFDLSGITVNTSSVLILDFTFQEGRSGAKR